MTMCPNDTGGVSQCCNESGGQFFSCNHTISSSCLTLAYACMFECACIVVSQSVRVHIFTDVSQHRHITCCLTSMGHCLLPISNLESVYSVLGLPPPQGVATATSLQGVCLMVCGTE